MPKYKAKRNLTIGEGTKEEHKQVTKGDVFECSEEYADEHLHPHEHVEETDEPVTEHPAVKKVKAAKAAKAEAKKKAEEAKGQGKPEGK